MGQSFRRMLTIVRKEWLHIIRDPRTLGLVIIMPVMMLVMFYSMASGLVLYWTANQCVSIVQQLLTKYRARMKPGKTA